MFFITVVVIVFLTFFVAVIPQAAYAAKLMIAVTGSAAATKIEGIANIPIFFVFIISMQDLILKQSIR